MQLANFHRSGNICCYSEPRNVIVKCVRGTSKQRTNLAMKNGNILKTVRRDMHCHVGISRLRIFP